MSSSPQPQAYSMSSSMINVPEHWEYGYGRIHEFEQDRQRDFVQHKRHVFLCYGSSSSWPEDFVADEPDSLPGKLLASFKSHEGEFEIKTIITVCEPSEDANVKEGDVLIFPDLVKYSLTTSSVDTFVKRVLAKEKLSHPRRMKPMKEGSYVFVCAHNAHDRRSGVCGQLVMAKVKEIVEINNIQGLLFPIPCSNIGVPEFSANIIIFSRGYLGMVDGHWYTYVCPIEVCDILYFHIVQGEVYRSRWRGKMGNERPLEIPQYDFDWWHRGPDKTIGNIDLIDGTKMVGWGRPESMPRLLPNHEKSTLPLHFTSEEMEAYKRNSQLMLLTECEDEGKMPRRREPAPIVEIMTDEEYKKQYEDLRKRSIKRGKGKMMLMDY